MVDDGDNNQDWRLDFEEFTHVMDPLYHPKPKGRFYQKFLSILSIASITKQFSAKFHIAAFVLIGPVVLVTQHRANYNLGEFRIQRTEFNKIIIQKLNFRHIIYQVTFSR